MEDELRRAFAEEPVPPRLWPRIQASLEKAEAAGIPPAPSIARGISYRALMPIAAMLLLVIVGIGLLARNAMMPAITQSDVAMVPINEFRTFEASGRALDFASADPSRVREWFLAKVDLPLPLPVAESRKARLTGGRLCYFFDRRVASFMYVLDGQSISLYVMCTDDLPVATLAEARVVNDGEHTAVVWTRGTLAYVLVSRLTVGRAADLLRGMAPSTQI